jgi:hypothetical protein
MPTPANRENLSSQPRASRDNPPSTYQVLPLTLQLFSATLRLKAIKNNWRGSVSPQVSFTVPARLGEAMDELAVQTNRDRHQLARDWVVERSVALGMRSQDPAAQVADARAASPVETTGTEALRDQYRPEDVQVLLVGESAPAGGTFFYTADSNLFHATREAFERALGPMPHGQDFLAKFAEMSFWLYDMVDEPVNRKPGRPRKHAVSAGVERLAALISELEPDYVVGIKTSIEGPVKRAATIARFPAGQVRILPFPLYQWREEYVRELAKFLRGEKEPATPAGVADPDGQRLSLHEAMTAVLRDLGGGPAPARQIANEVASHGLYARRDGSRADYQQLLLRARKYPHLFEISSRGIALAR